MNSEEDPATSEPTGYHFSLFADYRFKSASGQAGKDDIILEPYNLTAQGKTPINKSLTRRPFLINPGIFNCAVMWNEENSGCMLARNHTNVEVGQPEISNENSSRKVNECHEAGKIESASIISTAYVSLGIRPVSLVEGNCKTWNWKDIATNNESELCRGESDFGSEKVIRKSGWITGRILSVFAVEMDNAIQVGL